MRAVEIDGAYATELRRRLLAVWVGPAYQTQAATPLPLPVWFDGPPGQAS